MLLAEIDGAIKAVHLPDSARQLKLTDFWDGGPADCSAPIEVHLELSDFATDMA
ncbi:hypothetical protein NKJ46_32085 [Mesorhizobium sp. M0166]|uniref:hypothetical protein n=1 Tax=unclassified Mesorhizobium TaxID=325217 RepID=UPI003335ECFD